MSPELPIDDETLMAYADGELNAAQAAQVESVMQRDATVAARVTQHRALRAQLHSGLSNVLAEPVPERLLNMLAAPTATVTDLAQARQRKAAVPRQRWQMREWTAMAASLVAGIVLGLSALNFNSSNLVAARDGAVLAQGGLATALNTQLASTASNDQSVKIGVSFRNHAGAYCRSFNVPTSSMAGLACRADEHWRVQMMTETAADNRDEFRQAGSATPAAILAAIEQQIAGEPLDAQAEVTAQRAGWQ